MRRSFVVVTAGVGTTIGLLVTVPARAVIDPSMASLLGTVVACLFVGTVFELLGDR